MFTQARYSSSLCLYQHACISTTEHDTTLCRSPTSGRTERTRSGRRCRRSVYNGHTIAIESYSVYVCWRVSMSVCPMCMCVSCVCGCMRVYVQVVYAVCLVSWVLLVYVYVCVSKMYVFIRTYIYLGKEEFEILHGQSWYITTTP